MHSRTISHRMWGLSLVATVSAILLAAMWMATQANPASAAPTAPGDLAYSSFEEPPVVGGQYVDTITSTVSHELIQNPGEPIVVYTNTVNELGFSSYYSNTRNSDGLTDGDFVGVTDFTGAVGSYADGMNGFQISDPDGMMIVTMDEVDLSGATAPLVTVDHYVASTGWESDDVIHIWVEVDGGATVDLVNTAGSDINDLGVEGQWLTASADLTGYTTATLKFALDANSGSEAIYIDNIRFRPEPGPYLAVEKTAGAAFVQPGEMVTYTITAQNVGTDPDSGVMLTDTLPTEVDFDSWIFQPAGATVVSDVIAWNGSLTVSEQISLSFSAVNNASLGDTVVNTAMLSGSANMDSSTAEFTSGAAVGEITFVYHDLEDVVLPGDFIFLAGNFNGFDNTALTMTANADNSVFTATVPNLDGTLEYKYVVDDGGKQWDWLNTDNRFYDVAGDTVLHEYRNITAGYANLNTSDPITVDVDMATGAVYAETFYNNVTNPAGAARGLVAEVGFGNDTDLSNWTWFPADFNAQNTNNDEYGGVMTPTVPGTYSYTVRFNGNSGIGNPNSSWVYADNTGVGPYPGGEFSVADLGVLNIPFDAVPIATARAGALDEVFSVEGTVTYVPGTYAFAGWALQDDSGGIAVFDGGLIPAIDYGDQVRMTGVRGEFSGETQFDDILYFENLGGGPEVTPVMTDTAVVDSGAVDGLIVTVEGLTEGLDNCNDDFFAINDGSGPVNIFIDSDTNIDLCAEFITGNGVSVTLTGFATNFNGDYQIKPRRPSDVTGIFDNPFVSATDPMDAAVGVPTTTTVDITFNEAVTTTADWYDISCTLSGNVSATADTGPATMLTITPDAALMDGDICTVSVLADQVFSQNTSQQMLDDYTFSFAVGTPTFGACSDPATLISFVQGDGDTSPLNGVDDVVVEAVVTARFDTLDGFYVQEETADEDGNAETSEGIFVYDPNGTVTAAAGTVVRLQANVSEFNGVTELVFPSDSAECGTDTLTPTVVTMPLNATDDWEHYEGMWISIEDELTVTDNYRLGRFGQVRLSVNGRLQEPTNVVMPGEDANQLENLNNRSYITLDDALTAQNPDPVIYPDPMLTFTNTLRGGDTVPNGVVGVLHEYDDNSADDYRLYPTAAVEFTETNLRPETDPVVDGSLQVASFNVLNYFTTFGERGADDAEEFERQRTKIINAIVEMDADIVGLMEIENHPTDEALIDLVDGLNAATAAGTYDYVASGEIGTDAIKVAMVYQPATVTPTGNFLILDSSVDPDFNDDKNRPVLIQSFTEQATGEIVTVAVNHFKSKGSSCNDVGDPNMNDGQGNCNLTRLAAAESLVDYLATDPTMSGSDNYLIIGDLNSYAMEDPIRAIEGAGYTDLIEQFQGTDAYGYTFDGNWGYLDHALSSPALTPQVSGAAVWHINADEPIVLDYNTNFKSPNQIMTYYSPELYRASDHDPVLVGLDLTAAPTGTAEVQVMHLAPFSDSDTAVDVYVDGSAVLTNVVFNQSSGYLSVPAGEHLLEVNLAGTMTTAISATVNLMADTQYSVLATGGVNGYPLMLMPLVDNNATLGNGQGGVRVGHLAPFTDTLSATSVDIVMDVDGSAVVTDVTYGAVSPYLTLPAGSYDLQIVAHGTETVIADLVPVTVVEGEYVSAFAIGDTMNQPLDVVAVPGSGFAGTPIPSIVQTGYNLYLPFILR